MNTAEHYSYRVRWSQEDEEYIGTVAELPSLSWLAPTRSDAFEGIQQVASDVVDDMVRDGETPPQPYAERPYSGRIVLRITPESHRQLALEAAEQKVSLNRLMAARLGAAS